MLQPKNTELLYLPKSMIPIVLEVSNTKKEVENDLLSCVAPLTRLEPCFKAI